MPRTVLSTGRSGFQTVAPPATEPATPRVRVATLVK
jgi:hypothetical protein